MTTEADVCVVGAGIAGLSTALLLAREGRSVVVVDDGGVGSGQTGQTTAHLANAIDDRYTEIIRTHGVDGARLAAESHTAAIDCIEHLVIDENIDCDFERVDGYLFAVAGEDADLLRRELEAAQAAGLAAVELIERAPLTSFDTGPCLLFPRQGQFHPLKYVTGLARALERRGGRIFTNTHAESIEGGEHAQVKVSGGGLVRAQDVVVATNTPVNDLVATHTKQTAYITYAVALQIERGSVPRALYWDTSNPYHYVRVQGGEARQPDLLIVGGEDHKTGQASDTVERFARLEAWARERFLTTAVEYRWSGQVMETIDGLAFIGRNPMDASNVFIVTGDSGMGMTHGTIAGILLTDLIVGRSNPWENLYDPKRLPLASTAELVRHNVNVAAQYTSWLTPGDVGSVVEISAGHGAVLRQGLGKQAVYRDTRGGVHAFSAVCPHLGCLVAWNDAAKTWDCPCHGSRFDCRGKVINGPANSDLTPISAEETSEAIL